MGGGEGGSGEGADRKARTEAKQEVDEQKETKRKREREYASLLKLANVVLLPIAPCHTGGGVFLNLLPCLYSLPPIFFALQPILQK